MLKNGEAVSNFDVNFDGVQVTGRYTGWIDEEVRTRLGIRESGSAAWGAYLPAVLVACMLLLTR